MMRKALSLLLAICLVMGLLPPTTLATGEEASLVETPTGVVLEMYAGTASSFDHVLWTATPDDEVVDVFYATTDASGRVKDITSTYISDAITPWNIKLDNTKTVAELTLKDAYLYAQTSSSANVFGSVVYPRALKVSGAGDLKIIVDGDGTEATESTLKAGYSTPFTLAMGGTTTITSVNNTKLKVESAGTGGFVGIDSSGKLVLENANVYASANTDNNNNTGRAISVSADMDVKGGTLAVLATKVSASGIWVTGTLTITDGAAVTVTKTSPGHASALYDIYAVYAGAGVKFGGAKLIITDSASNKHAVSGRYNNAINIVPDTVTLVDEKDTVVVKVGNNYLGTDADAPAQTLTAGNIKAYRYISLELVCGEDNHAYDSDKGLACSKCGATRDCTSHKYDDLYTDTTCNLCGAIREVPKNISVSIAGGSIAWNAAPGEIYYATTSTSDVITDLGAQTTEPAFWNIKLDNTKAVAELTLKGALIRPGDPAAMAAAGAGALKIIVSGASLLQSSYSDTLTLSMAGGTTITSLNNSKLSVVSTSTAMHKSVNVSAGSLSLQNANMFLSGACRNSSWTTVALYAAGQDVTIAGGTLAISAYNKSTNAICAKNLTIKDYAKVTATHSVRDANHYATDCYENIPADALAAKRMYGINATGELVLNNASLTIINKDAGEYKGSWIYTISKMPTGLANVEAKYSGTDDGANLQELTVADANANISYPYVTFNFVCDGHTYDSVTDADCNKCGDIREVPDTEPEEEPEPEKQPFYMVNWMGAIDEELPYNITVMPKPSLYPIREDTTKVAIELYGITDIPTMAQMLKNQFDSMPAGTRYLNFPMDVEAQVEHMIYMDKTVAMLKSWIDEFFTEYKRIGGEIDGLVLDTEYSPIGAYYIHSAYKKTETTTDLDEGTTITLRPNISIYNDIVSDPRYATDVRPYLEERGFPFSTPNGYEDEIYSISATDGDYTAYQIWDAVMRNRYCKYINDACAPFMELYPYANVSNYRFSGGNQWEVATSQSGGQLNAGGNTMYAGNTANENFYLRRPYDNMRNTKTGYVTPITYNEAVYEDNPYNAFLMETSIFKDMYASSDNKKISAWIAGFNYQAASTRPDNGVVYTAYYAETLFHIGLLDPQPFIGYVVGPRDTDNNEDGYDYDDVMQNISDVLTELNRLVGYADRKPISVQRNWNSNFVLSGMYAAGRNVWRITPNTSEGATLESFKVKDQAPTFTIDGETVIFPQGRIIEDRDVSFTGTCGYWIETPADVMPVIITDEDRYEEYPAYEENFNTYTVGTAFSETARHTDGWTVSGTAKISSHNGSNALELSGMSTTVTNTKIPANVTAGDSYAKQQLWEVTVTIPSNSYGTVNVLSCGGSDKGIKISNGKIYYNNSTQLATVTKGSTYIISREVDFRNASAFTCTYTVRNTDGTIVAQAANVAMPQVSLPVKSITFSSSSVSAYIDNYRLQAIGVTTELRLYEADTGMRISDATATTTEDAVYRLSWMNASGEYQIAKIYNNGTLIKTVEMPSGADSFITGHVSAGAKLTVSYEKATAPTYPDYDTGDFDWKEEHSVNHKNTYDVEGKAPTCTEPGKTISRYCYDCEAWVITQQIIPATGHKYDNAADPDCNDCGEVREVPKDITVTLSGSITWNIAPGEIYYATTTTAGAVTDLGKLESEPNAWQIKLDNTKPVAELTLKSATIKPDSSTAIAVSGNGTLKMIVDGASTLQTGAAHTLALAMAEGTTITSVNNSKLSVVTISTSMYAAIEVAAGSLTLQDANVYLSAKNANSNWSIPVLLARVEVSKNVYEYFDVTVAGGRLEVESKAVGVNGILAKNLTINNYAKVAVTNNGGSYSALGDAAITNKRMYGVYTTGEVVINKASLEIVNKKVGESNGSWLYAINKMPALIDTDAKYSTVADGSVLQMLNPADPGALIEYPYVVFIADCDHANGNITEATCTERAVCATCQNAYGELGHTAGAAADCTNAQFCTECGGEIAPAKGHSPGAAADCVNAQTCTVCGTELDSAKGHSYVNHNAKVPTCTEIGWEAYQTCNNCDYTTYVEIAATGHDYVDHDAKAPTCTEIGWEAYQTCNNCDYTTYAEIAAKGHNADGVVAHVDATCTEDGVVGGNYCTACNDGKAAAEKVIPATGHDYVNHEAKAPTCTEIGWDAYDTCENCDYTTYAKIAAKGHNADGAVAHVDATCTEDGVVGGNYCTACNDGKTAAEAVITAPGHSFTVFVKTVKPTDKARGYTVYKCANCDETEVRDVVAAHTDAVAMFEGEYYDTLVEALAAAKESVSAEKVITMIRKQTGAALVINTNVTIDFAGLTYTVNTANENGSAVNIAGGAVVTLKNGTIQVRTAVKTLFNYLVVNDGDLTTEAITLRGDNLAAAGERATVVNNDTLKLNVGTVVNASKIALVATKNVTKDASVEVEAPEGYYWVDGTTLKEHVHEHDYTFDTVVVEANFDRSGYTRHICACGESYVDSVVANLVAYAVNETTGERYETLAQAVADAKVGETVKLLKKQTGAALVINADITINLDGMTYTVNKHEGGAAIVVAEGVEAKITNGMVQIRKTNRAEFDCLVNNLGALEANDITLNATYARAEGAVAIKGNAVTGNYTNG